MKIKNFDEIHAKLSAFSSVYGSDLTFTPKAATAKDHQWSHIGTLEAKLEWSVRLKRGLLAVLKIIMLVFCQGTVERILLEATKDGYLLHHPPKGSTKDTYWSDHGDGTGANTLGRMLMQIRDGGPMPPRNQALIAKFAAQYDTDQKYPIW